MSCLACENPPFYGEVVIHAVPEVLRTIIDAINAGDVRTHDGLRLTVSLRSAEQELGDGHVMLEFQSHLDDEE